METGDGRTMCWRCCVWRLSVVILEGWGREFLLWFVPLLLKALWCLLVVCPFCFLCFSSSSYLVPPAAVKMYEWGKSEWAAYNPGLDLTPGIPLRLGLHLRAEQLCDLWGWVPVGRSPCAAAVSSPLSYIIKAIESCVPILVAVPGSSDCG